MAPDTDSVAEVASSFSVEYERLCEMVVSTLKKPDALSLADVVGHYFQVMSVNSHITLLKKHVESGDLTDPEISEQIRDAETLISETFDKKLHPLILSQLTESIDASVKQLQSNQSMQKSRKDVEDEAKMYDALREKMSTKEFVEQYGKGLAHD